MNSFLSNIFFAKLLFPPSHYLIEVLLFNGWLSSFELSFDPNKGNNLKSGKNLD